MNYWTKLSIEYANQRSYLDDLFKVYPTIPDAIREIDKEIWGKIESSFDEQDNTKLIENLLELKLFPIKDSYVAYLRKDKTAINRNPQTINRLAGRIYELGLNKVYDKCTEPKETNRQIGPMFKNWIDKGVLGIEPVSMDIFMDNSKNSILSGTDKELYDFAVDYCGYEYMGNDEKGLDFVARFNNKYIIGETKFLTDTGGHQNAQFDNAINVLNSKTKENVINIAILDGILYIKNGTKIHKKITDNNMCIMSALMLRDFLYQV